MRADCLSLPSPRLLFGGGVQADLAPRQTALRRFPESVYSLVRAHL